MLQELEPNSDGLPPDILVAHIVAKLDLDHTADTNLGKILAVDIGIGIGLGWKWSMKVADMAKNYQKLPFKHGPLPERSILSHFDNTSVLNATTVPTRLKTKGHPKVYPIEPFCAYLAFLHTRDDEYETGGNYKAHATWLKKTRERLGEEHLLTGYLKKETDSETSQKETANEEIERALKSVTVGEFQEWAVTLGKVPSSMRMEEVSAALLARVGIEMSTAVFSRLCELPADLKRVDNRVAVTRDEKEMPFSRFVAVVKSACQLLEQYPEVTFDELTEDIKESRGKGLSALASLLKTPKSR